MYETETLMKKYTSYSGSAAKEFAFHGVIKETTPYRTNMFFVAGGMGVDSDTQAETLGGLLEAVKANTSCEGGKRSHNEIESGTQMTKTHYDAFISKIETDIENYGEDTGPLEWVQAIRE